MQLFFSEKQVALHLGYRPSESAAATRTLGYEHNDKGILLFSKQPDRLGVQPASCSKSTGGTADVSYCSTFVSISCRRQELVQLCLHSPIRRHDVTATVLEVGGNAKFYQSQCRWLCQSQEVL